MKVVTKAFGGGVSFDDLPSGAVYRNEPGSEHLFVKLVLPPDGMGVGRVYQIHLNDGRVCRPPTTPLVWPVAGAFVEE
jgi:hypothetical protein